LIADPTNGTTVVNAPTGGRRLELAVPHCVMPCGRWVAKSYTVPPSSKGAVLTGTAENVLVAIFGPLSVVPSTRPVRRKVATQVPWEKESGSSNRGLGCPAEYRLRKRLKSPTVSSARERSPFLRLWAPNGVERKVSRAFDSPAGPSKRSAVIPSTWRKYQRS